MSEEAPGAQHSTQQLLQDVVFSVIETHSGGDVDVIEAALVDGLAGAGIPPQPEKWVADTAGEIAEGRHVVVDRTLGAGSGGND